jgi:hypothetical protein
MVYGKQDGPATLVIHGQDDKTWVSLATPMETRARQNLEASVRHILIHPAAHPASLDATFPAV